MKFPSIAKMPFVLLALLLLMGCDSDEQPGRSSPNTSASESGAQGDQSGHNDEEGEIHLNADQIRNAGIEMVRVTPNGGGALMLPATVEGDPEGMQVVSASVDGRVVSLTRNLGQPIERGDTLALIEGAEAASLNAEIEAARARLTLADANLSRERRLFRERVSPEQDLISARTAAIEAAIALRLAQQRVSAVGRGGGALNRIAISAPLSGHVVARNVTLGQTVTAGTELYRVANLEQVAVSLALSPTDAGKVRPGSQIEIASGERKSAARINFVSPILDEETRLARVIAIIDNRAGHWRVGEPVTASIQVSGSSGPSLLVPQDAVQSIEGRPTVFVRTDHGFMATPVTLGAPNGSNIVVTSGLKGDELLAGLNSFILKAELGKGEAEHGH